MNLAENMTETNNVKVLDSGTYINSAVKNSRNLYVIGLEHKNNCHIRKNPVNMNDIKRVGFTPNNEKEAIALFVDTNRENLIKLGVYATTKRNFYPHVLFDAYKQYLLRGSIPDEVPIIPAYGFKRKRLKKTGKFCDYMRRRVQPLLADPESLFHNCDFLNKLVE